MVSLLKYRNLFLIKEITNKPRNKLFKTSLYYIIKTNFQLHTTVNNSILNSVNCLI